MKLTHKPAICITRLRKKSTASLIKNQAQNQSEHVFAENINKKKDTQKCQEYKSLHSSRALTSLALNSGLQPESCQKSSELYRINQNSIKENTVKEESAKSILTKQIQDLKVQNETLKESNISIRSRLIREENQKQVLRERIHKLEQSVEQISHQVQQQNAQPIKSIVNSFSVNTTPKSSLILENRLDVSMNRRMSHDNAGGVYLPEDFSTQIKDYKNQLEIQKLRRYNLEIQLKNCRQNAKIEFRSQIQVLTRQVKQHKQTIASRDKQILEKDGLINRFLMKKSSIT